MSERLTEKNKISCFEYDLANFKHKVKEFNDYDAFYAYNMAVRKLGELEDILEQYGIENVEELSNALEFAKVIEKTLSEYGIKDNEELEELLDDNKYAQNVVVKQLVELKNAKTDRDTWQKACELMGKKFLELYCSDYCGNDKDCDKCIFKNITSPQYFYQQAKKEGNDERKN